MGQPHGTVKLMSHFFVRGGAFVVKRFSAGLGHPLILDGRAEALYYKPPHDLFDL